MITVVSGFPRSGTSLMMQMLCAAGMRCAGDAPGFEPEETLPNGQGISPVFCQSMQDGAFKLLDPHRTPLPRGFNYRVIWMRRSRTQQARSMVKMLSAIFPSTSRAASISSLAESLAADEPIALGGFRELCAPILQVRFEDLIDRPDQTVATVADWLGLDPAKMRPVIRPRSSACLEGLLEFDLMTP